nr:hypothetical protein [Tanacetum cinerariifolium]
MPASAPISLSSKWKEIMSSTGGSKRKRLGFSGDMAPSPVFKGRHTGFISPLAGSKEGEDADPFLPCYFFYPSYLTVFAFAPVFTYLDSLLEILRHRSDVFTLKASDLSLLLLSSGWKLNSWVLKIGHRLVHQFEEKEDIMLVIKASLKTELEVLTKKIDLANKDHSLMAFRKAWGIVLLQIAFPFSMLSSEVLRILARAKERSLVKGSANDLIVQRFDPDSSC